MQLRPLFTGASGSPWVATTRPSFTPTSTPQPVPQKRHTPLAQRMPASLVTAAIASFMPGMVTPAAAAVAAMALVLMKSRRVSFMSDLLSGTGFEMVINHGGRQHAAHIAKTAKGIGERIGALPFHRDHHPPVRAHGMDFHTGQRRQRAPHGLGRIGKRMDQYSGDVHA